jgi:HK97 family phage major capsid protein
MPTALAPNADLGAVRKAAGEAALELLEIRSKPADQRTDDHRVAAKELAEFIHDADIIAKGLDMARTAAEPEARGGRSNGADLQPERRSMGEQVVSADGYDEWAARSGSRTGNPFNVEVRNLIGTYDTGAYAFGADAALPVASPIMVEGSMFNRRAILRDVMSVQSTGLQVVPYFRELNAITNESGAGSTQEGSAKTEVNAEFQRYSAIVEKITAWIPVTDEIISDAPTLRGYIDSRLAYMLMVREEQQILAGNGTSPQIQGLKTLSGVQTHAAVAGDLPGTLSGAIGKVENVDADANAVLLNPITHWTAVGKRYSTQFDNSGTGTAPGTVGNITWGLPSIRSRSIAAAQGWVGAFGQCSTLFDRQATTIKVGDQHADNFIRNILVILGEKRIAVAWHKPSAFVDVTVPTT